MFKLQHKFVTERQKINISEKVLPQQSKLEKNGLLLQG